MLPVRSLVQTSKTLNYPEEKKILSTYQSEYNTGYKYYGNPVNYIGNSAFLKRADHVKTSSTVRPFLSPSYRNITSDSYMANRLGDYYSNNYRTSEKNPLYRDVKSALPAPTKLANFYKYRTAPIASQDKLAVFEARQMNGWVNDHFVSKRPLKTETQTIRDILVLT